MDPASTSSFFVSGGTVPLGATSYVAREADRTLLEALRAGRYAYVLTSRQMGKSSLSVRTMEALRQEGVRTAFVDLTRIGGRNVTAEQWYAGLLGEVGRGLGDRAALLGRWKAHSELGPMQRFFVALGEVVAASPELVVVFIDEIDATKSLPFSTDEFFAGIRECFNRRVQEPAMARLAFCLIGVAIPSDLMSDTKLTPFNIGERVVLKDFSLQEALPLGSGLGSQGPALVTRVHHWTGGHPFLTQTLCRRLSEETSPLGEVRVGVSHVDRLVAEEFFEARARETNINLADVGNRVLNSFDEPNGVAKYRADILSLYESVLRGRKVPDDESNRLVAVLKLSGLVVTFSGRLQVRNRIYARVFDRTWIEEHTPNQELRRQRQAFRLGMIRAGAGAAVMLALVSALAVTAMGNAHRANDALAQVKRERDHITVLATQAENSRVEATINAQSARVAQRTAQAQSDRAISLAKARAEALTEARAQRDRADAQTKIAHSQTSLANEQKSRALASAEEARRAQGVATEQTTVAKRQTGIAVASVEEARRQTYENYVNGAHTAQLAFQAGRPAVAEPILRSLQTSPARGWETDFLTRESLQAATDGTTSFHRAPVNAVSFLGDGHQFLSGGSDGQVVVVDLATRTSVKVLSLNAEEKRSGIRSIAPITDGKSVMVLDDANGLTRLSLGAGGSQLRILTGDKKASDVAVSPDGRTVATCAEGGHVRLFLIDGDAVHAEGGFTCGTQPLTSIAFAPDGHSLATVSADGTVYRCALDGKVLWKSPTGAAQFDVAFASNGRSLASVGQDGSLRVYDAADGRERGHVLVGAPLFSVAPSRDGRLWAVSGSGGLGAVVNAANMSLGRRIAYPQDGDGDSVAVAPDGETVIGGYEKGAVHIWSVNPQSQAVEVLPFGGNEVNAVDACAKTGQVVAVSLVNGGWRVQTCDAKSWKPGWTLNLPTRYYAFGIALSPQGDMVALPTMDGNVQILDARDGRSIRNLSGDYVGRFSPDGSLLATYFRTGIILYDVSTGRTRLTLPHPSRTIAVAFSPDGRFLATGSDDYLVRLWDLRNPAQPRILPGHTSSIYGIAFSPDGRRLVSSGIDAARVWNVASGRETQTLRVRGGTGETAQFTADGTRIVTQMKGALESATHVWDAATGRELLALPGGPEGRALCVLPNTILAGYANGTLLAFNGLGGEERRRLEKVRAVAVVREKAAAEDEVRQAEAAVRQAKALAEKQRRETPFRRLLEEADDAYKASRYDEALRLYSKLKPQEPLYATAKARRANLLAGLGRFSVAFPAFEEFEEGSDESIDASWRIALLAYATGHQERYADLCNRVIQGTSEADLKGACAFYLWTVALDPEVLTPESRAKIERTVIAAKAAMDNSLDYAKFSCAFYLERVGRDREALDLLRGVSMDWSPAYSAMAQALVARASARLGDEASHRVALARMRVTKVLVEANWDSDPGNYNWDQRVVLEALARDAETPRVPPPAAAARAKAQEALEVRQAAVLAERLRREAATRPLVAEALAAMEAKRYPEAIAAYEQALKIDPENLAIRGGLASAYNRSGIALYSAGRIDDAIAAYRKASTYAPRNTTILFNLNDTLATKLYAEGRYAEIAELFRPAVERARVGSNLGIARDYVDGLMLDGQTDKARETVQRLVAPESAARLAREDDVVFVLTSLVWSVDLPVEVVAKLAEAATLAKPSATLPARLIAHVQALALLRSEHPAEALAVLDAIDPASISPKWHPFHEALRTILLSRVGRTEDAKKAQAELPTKLAAFDEAFRQGRNLATWGNCAWTHAIVQEALDEPSLKQNPSTTASPPMALGTLISALGMVYFLRRRLLP